MSFRFFPLGNGNYLTPEVAARNVEMMKRPAPAPRKVGPWHSASVHEDDCRCERCEALAVNGWAP